jgi:hypothetical protein
MKPFDVEKAKQGHPVCTRDGRDVEILKFDFKGSTGESLLGTIKNGAHEIPKTWSNSGRFDSMWGNSYDLFLKEENTIDFNTKKFDDIILEIEEWRRAGWEITYVEISLIEDDESWNMHIECFK